MRLTRLFLGLAVFSLLFFHPDFSRFENSAHAATASSAVAAPSASASNRGHISIDPRVMKARTLFNEKNFAGALEILRKIEFGRRNWKDIQFLRGMAAMESAVQTEPGDVRDALLAESVTAFRRILDADPELTRVRLELARVLYIQEDDEAAKEHFERVMVSDVHPNIKVNAQIFLDSIHQRRRLKWNFGMGLTRDTNIDSTSKERVVNFPRRDYLALRQVQFNLPKVDSGLGVSVSTGFDYSEPVSGKWVYSGEIFRSEYKGRQYDRMVMYADAGPRWFFNGGRQRLTLTGTVRRDWSGYDIPHFFEYGGRLQTMQFVGRDWQLVQSLSVSQRLFRQKFQRNSGGIARLSFDAYHRLNAVTRVNFGASTGWNRPRNKRMRNRTYGARIGTSRDFGGGITLGGSLSYTKTSYWGSGGTLTKDFGKRTDQNSSAQITLNKRDLTVRGFSPRLVFSRNRLRTNAAARSYNRNLIEIKVNRQL